MNLGARLLSVLKFWIDHYSILKLVIAIVTKEINLFFVNGLTELFGQGGNFLF